MFNGLASKNRSARGGERYLPYPGSIPELAETSSKKKKKKKKKKLTTVQKHLA